MEKFKILNSSSLLGLFFSMQAIGYLHGISKMGQAKIENSIAFGINHLSHIFQPHKAIAWPLSPFICGFLLLCVPILEESKPKIISQYENFIVLFISLIVPMSIGTIEVSIIGPVESASIVYKVSECLKYPVLLSLIYFFSYAVCFFICWKFRLTILSKLRLVFKLIPKSLLSILTIAWLIYGCYIGSRFDGALDHKTKQYDNVLIKGLNQIDE